MQYRAPVELWGKRHIFHKDNATTAITVFLAGALAFCVALAIVVFGFGDAIAQAFVPPNCDPSNPVTCKGMSPRGFLYVSFTVLVTSIALWLLKIQMKVYLSERHLSLDAQERKMFAETFLALREDKAVDPSHESVVLQSLFRPTQDGIIKDDASVDATPASLLARLLSKQN